MSMYLEGITSTELKALIKESVKEEFKAVLNEHEASSKEKTSTLLTRKQACTKLGISLTTLHDWRIKGIIPFYRINTRIRFKLEDLENILANPTGLKYNTSLAKR